MAFSWIGTVVSRSMDKLKYYKLQSTWLNKNCPHLELNDSVFIVLSLAACVGQVDIMWFLWGSK